MSEEYVIMKTIEERAKEYSLRDFDGYYTGRERAMEEGYIAGATEQQAIDEKVRLKKSDDMTKCRARVAKLIHSTTN